MGKFFARARRHVEITRMKSESAAVTSTLDNNTSSDSKGRSKSIRRAVAAETSGKLGVSSRSSNVKLWISISEKWPRLSSSGGSTGG